TPALPVVTPARPAPAAVVAVAVSIAVARSVPHVAVARAVAPVGVVLIGAVAGPSAVDGPGGHRHGTAAEAEIAAACKTARAAEAHLTPACLTAPDING